MNKKLKYFLDKFTRNNFVIIIVWIAMTSITTKCLVDLNILRMICCLLTIFALAYVFTTDYLKPVKKSQPEPPRVVRNTPIPSSDLGSIRRWLDNVQDKHHG